MSADRAGINRTSLDPVLKEVYEDTGRARVMEYEVDSTLAKIARINRSTKPGDGGFEYVSKGKYAVIPHRLDRLNTVAKDFQTSQELARAKNATYGVWQVPIDKRTAVANVDLEVAFATEDEEGSFFQAMFEQTDLAVQDLSLKRSFDLWGDGTGIIGTVRVATTKSNKGVIQLETRFLMSRFAKGMEIDIFNSDSSSQRGSSVGIERIDTKNATIYLDAALPSGTVATDVIYQKGDQGKTHMYGIQSWIKDVSSETEAFAGEMRVNNPIRLGGVVLTPGAATASETSYQKVIDALIEAPDELTLQAGGTPMIDFFAMNNGRMSWILKNLSRNVSYERTQVNSGVDKVGEVSFDAVVIRSSSQKPAMLVSSPHVDPNKIFGLNLSSWARLYFTNEFVSFDSKDKLPYLRAYNDDSVELRAFSWMNLVCKDPGANVVIDLKNHKLTEPAALT